MSRSRWQVAGLTSLLTALGSLVAIPRLHGDESPPPVAATPPEPDEAVSYAPDRDFFTLFPADADALTFSDLIEDSVAEARAALEPTDPESGIPADAARVLAADTRQSVEDIDTWSQVSNGPDVTKAYSRLTAQAVKDAAAREAEYVSGLAGVGEVALP
jgi:hypothetical protein